MKMVFHMKVFFPILHILKKILPDCDYNLTNSLVNVNLFYDTVSVLYLYGYFLLRCINDINEEQSSGACSGMVNALRREMYLITCKFHILPDSAPVVHYKDQSVADVQRNHCFILWEYRGTHKYTVRKVQIFKTWNT